MHQEVMCSDESSLQIWSQESSSSQAWGGRACKTQALSALLGVEPESNLRLDPLLVMWLGHWPMAFKYNDVSISYNFVKIYPNLY